MAEWRQSAACLDSQEDPDFWCPSVSVRSDIRARRTRILKKRYCDQCPVVSKCAAECLRTRSIGIWAGVYVPYHAFSARGRGSPALVKLRELAEEVS